MCEVKYVEGATVYVNIEGNGLGTIVLSEVAAGRIRNLREYVSPGKKIVCKVLKVSGDHVELSLRRVTNSEKEYMLEKVKKEKTLKNILSLCQINSEEIITKIKKNYDIIDFFEKARENPEIFKEYLSDEQAQKIAKIFSEKEEKEKNAKKKFFLRTFSDNGLIDIQNILNIENAEIHYLGSSQFTVEVKGKDFKEANTKIIAILKEIEKRAKDKKAIFELLEKT